MLIVILLLTQRKKYLDLLE